MKHVMLDLETMGNTPQAAIGAIGAVEFDLDAGTIGERFYTTIDLQSAVAAGGVIDASTVLWWLKQGDQARADLTRPGLQITSALDAFSVWMKRLGKFGDVAVWGNGASFDNVILTGAYQRSGIATPWPFWADRCYRTLKALRRDVSIDHAGTAHNALDDAEHQARHLIEIHRAMSPTTTPLQEAA